MNNHEDRLQGLNKQPQANYPKRKEGLMHISTYLTFLTAVITTSSCQTNTAQLGLSEKCDTKITVEKQCPDL